MDIFSRPAKQRILMLLSAVSFCALAPFIFIRFMDGNYPVMLWNICLFSILFWVFYRVYKTGEIEQTSVVLAIALAVGSIGTFVAFGADNFYWSFPCYIGIFYLIHPRLALILCVTSFIVCTPFIVQVMTVNAQLHVLVSMLMTIAFGYTLASITQVQREELTTLSRTDPLTGLFNRRAMDERLESVYEIFQRSKLPASLISIDIDHFKQINDTHGHYVGDKVLISFGQFVTERLHPSYSIYRFGGEEFIIIMESTELRDATRFAEDLRQLIEAASFENKVKITVSMGVAELTLRETAVAWLERTDKLLFAAKQAGRNTLRY